MDASLLAPQVAYAARVRTIGGRDGGALRSDDGRLEIRHSAPGSKQPGSNPEQLFAAGWSACFEGALSLAARNMKITLPPGLTIDAEVDLRRGADGYSLAGRLRIHLPGLAPEVAQALDDAAHQLCPYSKATRGNIPVAIEVV